jgi:hypothetical protein
LRTAIGPDQDHHPMNYIFEMIQQIRCIRGKRKIKRGLNNQRFIYEASTGREYDINLLKECEVITDDNNRPIVENGRVKMEHRDEAIVGDDPLRPKTITFYPRKSDQDPYALHDSELDDEERVLHMVENYRNDAVRGEKSIEVVVVQPLYDQLLSLHSFIHFIEIFSYDFVHYLTHEAKFTPASFDDAWVNLTGDATGVPIGKFSKKTSAFTKILVNARNVLQHNLSMIQCDVCRKITAAQCIPCPECECTIRWCNSECKKKAMVIHAKSQDHKRRTVN